MEWRLLVERRSFYIAAVCIRIFVGSKLVVAMMFACKFIVGNVVVATVSEEPHIRLASSLQYCLEWQ